MGETCLKKINGPAEAGPIGVFDSGAGGLTALRQLRELLPGEDVIYFGDSGRMPYGGRPKDEIERMAAEDARFLLGMGAKALLIACGTITSNALPYLRERLAAPIFGVVAPAAEKAAGLTKNGSIGVFSTAASERSGAYADALRATDPGIRVTSASSGSLAALIESGVADGDAVRREIDRCAESFAAAGIDTLVLGCTHFSAVRSLVADSLPGVTIVDCGKCGAEAMASALRQNGMLEDRRCASEKLYTSGDTKKFKTAAAFFLGDAFSGSIFKADL